MASADTLVKTIEKIEKKFKFHGMWGNPYIPPPKIPIRPEWPDDIQKAAEVLNRIFYVRSLPDCSRLFGPVRESAVEAFQHDYNTPMEKVNYARNQLNSLIMDLGIVPGIDKSDLERVSE
jgi:hypothetical protein